MNKDKLYELNMLEAYLKKCDRDGIDVMPYYIDRYNEIKEQFKFIYPDEYNIGKWGVFYTKFDDEISYQYGKFVDKMHMAFSLNNKLIDENRKCHQYFIPMPFEEYKCLIDTDEIKKYILGKINE